MFSSGSPTPKVLGSPKSTTSLPELFKRLRFPPELFIGSRPRFLEEVPAVEMLL